MNMHIVGVLGTFAIIETCGLAADAPDFARLATGVAAYESGGNMEVLRQVESLVREAREKPELRRQLETALSAVLTGKSTFEGQRFACQWLAVVGSEESLPALARLLEGQETAGIACLALGSYPSAKAGDTLRDTLPKLRGIARVQAIDTLGDRREAASVKPLADLARDPDAVMAEAAISALGKIGGEPARKAIAALRRESRPELAGALTEASLHLAAQLAAAGDRQAAASAYEEFSLPSQPAQLRRAAIEALLRLDEDGGQQRILDVLHGGDAALKPAAIARVSALTQADTSDRFAAEMPKLEPELQILLIGALAARGDSPARQALAAQAQNPRLDVSLAAIKSLGRVGDAAAVPVLAGIASKDGPPDAARAALASLRQLKGGTADEAILAAAKQAPAAARPGLIDVLVGRQAAMAVPFLFEQASQEDAKPAAAALRGLGRLAEPRQLDALVGLIFKLRDPALQKDAAAAVVQVARKIADPAKQSEALLAAYRKADTAAARCALLRVLAGTGGPAALDAVLAAAKDADEGVREAAVRALASWPDPSAAKTVLDQARAAANPAHQVLLLRGGIRLLGLPSKRSGEEALAGYADALRLAARPDEKRLVIAGLSGAAPAGALELVAPMLDDPALQAEAALALLKIVKARPETGGEQAKAALQKAASIIQDPAQQKEVRGLLGKMK